MVKQFKPNSSSPFQARMSSTNKKVMQALAETISQKVEHFSKKEVECLIRKFNTLLEAEKHPDSSVPGLDRNRFKDVLHNLFELTDDFILDRVFKVFDKDNDSFVSVEEWIQGLSVFLRGTPDEQIKCKFSTPYCFQVYDLTGSGFITKDEIYLMLKDSLPMEQQDEEDEMNELIEIVLKMMDYDKDGRLSFEDFEKSVKKEDLILEAFGKCLPNFRTKKKFEEQVLEKQQDE
ncbi:EF-hand calcium-binding domain-containing protein 1 [Oryzias melastigma]|uniref:EF-hand calcium-binding domain-containing protein 1 n=1 Tax=Oryzias melastigma TaxID=30732 RepID=A0A834BXK2_ORYME|nr:EF-hand calcium-binding domain-containing protein 1 [Oryzias melastigma]